MVQKGVVELQYISMDDQTAYVLTKPLPRVKFEYFRERLGVEENLSPCPGTSTRLGFQLGMEEIPSTDETDR